MVMAAVVTRCYQGDEVREQWKHNEIEGRRAVDLRGEEG